MEIVKPNLKIRFMSQKNRFLVVSGLLVLSSLILLFTTGLNFGIDFKGGLELQFRFDHAMDIGTIRGVLESAGEGSAIVQKVTGATAHDYIVSFEQEAEGLHKKSNEIVTLFENHFSQAGIKLLKVDSVGPRVGADLKTAAILAVLYALLLILGYIWFRFDIAFSPAAVTALVHDVSITLGILVLLKVEFGLAVVAAILTIVGYSLNDTIVIFDRIRDNTAQFGNLALDKVIDRSINECMSRTLLTSMTTLVVVIILIFYGGPALYPFAVTLAIGVVVGTYSSIYVASSVTLFIDRVLGARRQTSKRKQT